MEIEVLCSELEWERPSPARETTIEELQFQGRVESYVIWVVPALVISSCMGTICGIYVRRETVTPNSDATRLVMSGGSNYVFKHGGSETEMVGDHNMMMRSDNS